MRILKALWESTKEIGLYVGAALGIAIITMGTVGILVFVFSYFAHLITGVSPVNSVFIGIGFTLLVSAIIIKAMNKLEDNII